MRRILFCLSLIAGSFSYAESLPGNYYEVVSSEFDETVPAGKVKLYGTVTETYSGGPIANGLISNFVRSAYIRTDEKGYYEFLFPAKDTSLFFYHENYGEVVAWSIHFDEQHKVNLNFVVDDYSDYPIEVEKPVIYVYGEEGTVLSIELKPEGEMVFSYPEYKDGWNLSIAANGLLKLASGTEVPYLFWEASSDNLISRMKGIDTPYDYWINADSSVSFLENTLDAFSLTSTERTDFITYWAPRMEKHAYLHVSFYLDQNCTDLIGNLTVQPVPEEMRRVYMVFYPVSAEQVNSTGEYRYPETLNRQGLTVVEWGGSEIKFPSLN